jgi:IS66 Orf2 like protein
MSSRERAKSVRVRLEPKWTRPLLWWWGYIFRGRRGDKIKILWYSGDGLALFYKRLSTGLFTWPQVKDGTVQLSSARLSMLLEGIGVLRNSVQDGCEEPAQPHTDDFCDFLEPNFHSRLGYDQADALHARTNSRYPSRLSDCQFGGPSPFARTLRLPLNIIELIVKDVSVD